MALVGETFFYGVTDGVYAVPFDEFVRGEGEPKKIAELPAGGYNNHWTRNILPGRDGKKLYVASARAAMSARTAWSTKSNARIFWR